MKFTLARRCRAIRPFAASSQTITAYLGGTIVDPTGAAVPNARIRIVNTATNAEQNLSAGSRGEFLAPSMPAGLRLQF